MTTVTATTPTETGITRRTSRTMSVEQYLKRIWLMHAKRSYTVNETCLWWQVARQEKIEEIIRFLKLCIQDLPLKLIALKVILIMPVLCLQKPSKKSKLKHHLVSLERRLKLWEEGNISSLLHEGETIQERMKIREKGVNIEKISLKFKNMRIKGKANGALKDTHREKVH